MITQKLKYLWYFISGWPCRFFCLLMFQIRAYNYMKVPRKGGFLLVCNHQCLFDPMFAVIPVTRQFCFTAKDSLFRIPLLGWLIRTYNSIPIKRGKPDLAAVKLCVERLKQGYGLIIFPEATRTQDGKIDELKPGFGLLARKANVPIIPVVIDGAFECWPKHRKLPLPGQIHLVYGDPIPPEKIASLDDRELAKYLTVTLRGMQTELRLKIGKEPFDYPPPCLLSKTEKGGACQDSEK